MPRTPKAGEACLQILHASPGQDGRAKHGTPPTMTFYSPPGQSESLNFFLTLAVWAR